MGLQGTIDTLPVTELVRWLAQSNATGILTFKQAARTKRLTVEKGKVVNAASTDPREFFGQFLINFGMVTEDQLQKAFETQQETKVLIGKILVMTGMVSEEQILRMLHLKIRETVLDVFLWDHGLFDFQDGLVPDDPSVVPISVTLKALHQEGIGRRKSHCEIRKSIPNNVCQFACLKDALPKDIDPRSANGVMIEMAREGGSVADIILRFHSLDYPILRNLFDLVQKGWLSVIEVDGVDLAENLDVVIVDENNAGAGPDRYLQATQQAIKTHDFEKAIALLRQGLGEHPYDPDLCQALEVAEKGLTDKLKSGILADDRVPFLMQENVLASSRNWTPAQRYILSRIDGQRALRSIVMVSPLKEVEALQTFHDLLKAKLISFR